MKRVMVSIDDYRLLTKKRIPKFAFDYVDGGADSEHTVGANRAAFQEISFRPHQALGPDVPDLSTTVLGHELSLPVMLAPCGSARVIGPGGDVAGASAAGAAGTVFVLSTMSNHSIEEVAAAGSGALWYQVYRVGARECVEEAIAGAAKAGYRALVVTVDTQVSSLRERDRHNRLADIVSGQPHRMVSGITQALARPGWLIHRLQDGLYPKLENVLTDNGGQQIRGNTPSPVSLTWEDLAWVREQWSASVLVKGVLTGEDTRRAIDAGMDGVIVSNHGGRQLDYAEATLRVLPEVVKAAEARCAVLFDGGIWRGTDVMKALCLGASAVLIGRAWIYGLGARGERGISEVIELLRADMVRNMSLLGARSVAELGPDFVRIPRDWQE